MRRVYLDWGVEDRGDRSASRGGMRMQVELLKVA